MSVLVFAVVTILLVALVVYLLGLLGIDPKAKQLLTAALVVVAVLLVIGALLGWVPAPRLP